MFSLIALIGFSFAASAQTAAPASQPRPQFARAIFDVPSMATEEQFLQIKPTLETTEGIRFTNIDATRHQVVFSYDPSKISASQIGAIITQKGYTNTLNLTTETPRTAPKQ